MLGPKGVISIGSSFQSSYQCEVESCELVMPIIAFEQELKAIRATVEEEALDSNWKTGASKPVEGTKKVSLDPGTSRTKVAWIGSALSPL